MSKTRAPSTFNLVESDRTESLAAQINAPIPNLAIATVQSGFVFNNWGQSESEKAKQHRKDICDWLDAPDPRTNYYTARQKRLDGTETGTWFVQGDEFKAWRTTPRSFIWLYGIPGCGKTVLNSTIIEDVLDKCQTSPGKSCAYFFFDFNDDRKRQYKKMIHSIVLQLTLECKEMPKSLDSLFANCQEWKRPPHLHELLKVLNEILTDLDDVVLILDALDECKDTKNLLDGIWEIVCWGLDQLHILVTSRREKDILTAMNHIVRPHHHIDMRNDKVNDDIRVYVQKRLQTDDALGRWRNKRGVQEEIEKKLMQKAGGMFRWAVCQLDALAKCIDRRRLNDALEALPDTLDATYERILSSIPDKYADDALRVLQWLIYSTQPLLLKEIVDVVAVCLDAKPRFVADNRMPETEDILEICSSLVAIVDETRKEKEVETTTRVVRLAHFSVQEYLISERPRAGPVAKYIIQELPAHRTIAEVCLAYLLQFNESDLFTIDSLEELHLANYAAKYWTHHALKAKDQTKTKDPSYSSTFFVIERIRHVLAQHQWLYVRVPYFGLRDVQSMDIDSIDSLCMELFSTNDATFTAWIRIYDLDQPEDTPTAKTHSPSGSKLYYASLAGLMTPVKELLEKDAKVNEKGGRLGFPLHAAAFNGHHQVVQFLLEKGAKVNERGGEYVTALYAAADGGHTKVVRLLIEWGADVNAIAGSNGTALQTAAEKGRTSVVELLLKKHAEVNKVAGRSGCALQGATAEGHTDVMKLLLDHGALPNQKCGVYRHTLLAAVWPGHGTALKLLLEHGADVDAMDELYSNALYGAAFQGNESMVIELLKRDAKIDDQGEGYGTALYAAALGGYDPIVKLLLNKGADVNKVGGYYGNPMQAAAKNGHMLVLQSLLKSSAKLGIECGFYGTEFFAAYDRDQKEVAQLLLEMAAKQGVSVGSHVFAPEAMTKENLERENPPAEHERCTHALQAAIHQGDEQMVKVLLDHGVDPNAEVKGFWKPLYAAADRGHETIVQLLLEHKAEVNAPNVGGRGYGNALQAAARCGNEAIVKMLLLAGAEVNAQGGMHSNALQAAAYEGRESVVKLLLAKGADVEARGGKWRTTALQAASWGGNAEVVRMLLENGADVDAPGGEWSTAMQAATLKKHEEVLDLLKAYQSK